MPVINWSTVDSPQGFRWTSRVNMDRPRASGYLALNINVLEPSDGSIPVLETVLDVQARLNEWCRNFRCYAMVKATNEYNVLVGGEEARVTLAQKWEIVPYDLVDNNLPGQGPRWLLPTTQAMQPRTTSWCCGSGFHVQPGTSRILCNSCEGRIACETCGLVGATNNYDSNLCPGCYHAEDAWYCFSCDERFTGDEQRNECSDTAGQTAVFCNRCSDGIRCQECREPSMEVWNSGRRGATCTTCAQALVADFQDNMMEIPADQLPLELTNPSLPERPFRTITIETEVDGDSNRIGQTLYSCGLISRPQLQNYSANAPDNGEHVAFFKSDSTVTGGEILLPFMELDTEEHVAAMHSLMQVLKTLERDNAVSLSPSCGGHIHMTAQGLGHHDVWRLMVIYNYLENTLYHIAGADAPDGHRSIGSDDDPYDEGHDYASPTLKGPYKTLTNMGRELMRQGRNTGLNLKNYFEAINHCGCGAQRMGAPQECTCTLPKHTIEWRLWGATLNPRIIHAQVAIIQGATAFAQNEMSMSPAEEDRYPVFAWDREHFPRTTTIPSAGANPLLGGKDTEFVTKTKERLEWMHTKLPLTRAERDSLIYTAKKSELIRLGSPYLDSLMDLPNESALLPKKERSQRRMRNILGHAPQMPLPEQPEVAPSAPFDPGHTHNMTQEAWASQAPSTAGANWAVHEYTTTYDELRRNLSEELINNLEGD